MLTMPQSTAVAKNVWCPRGGSRNLRKGGGRSLLLFSRLPFPFSLSLFSSSSLEVGPLEPATSSIGSAIISIAGFGAEPWPKTNLVHSKAARKH